MIYLGEFKAGDSVFYAGNFHNETGTLENPTSPEAQLRTPAGVWSSLTAPAAQNAKTGHYGGTIDTAGYASGQYVGRMAGQVTTGKTVAMEFYFKITGIRAASINDASPTTTKFISTLTEATNDYWNNGSIKFTSGPNEGVIRGIKDYNGATKEVTLNTALPVAPTNGNAFEIIEDRAYKLAGVSLAEFLAGLSFAKNTEVANFMFPMVDANGAAITGLTVTAQRSIDGAAFAACANLVAEVGNGTYKITLAAADMNGDVIMLKFTAPTARQVNYTIMTEG